MKSFDFGSFIFEHDKETGATYTRYHDGHWTGGEPIPDDAFHAERLGITAEQHRLVHELVHHLVGFKYYNFDGSPVLYKSARLEELPQPDTELEEWMVTAWTYAFYEKEFDKGALILLSKKVNLTHLAFVTKLWMDFYEN
jgi:hypothetical protein